MSYRYHEQMVAPARRQAELWRIVVGVVMMGAIYLFTFLAAIRISDWLYNPLVTTAWRIAMERGVTPKGMLALLYSFAGLALAAIITVRILHNRPAGTLFGPAAQAWVDFRRVTGPLLLFGLIFAPFYILADATDRNLPFGMFLMWLPLAIPGLLIQTGAEELVFRGYLQQQLAARFRNPFFWMLMPSLMFALGHHAPEQYGQNALLVSIWAGVFGLLAADLTARTGSIGAAIGFHFATNFFAMFVIGIDGDLSGLALYTIRADLAGPEAIPVLGVDFATMAVAWLLCRVRLRR